MMNKRKQTGFTLIEVMVVMVIMAVLVSMGATSYQQISYRTSVRGLSNDIQGVITQARVYAMTIGENVTVCPFKTAVPPVEMTVNSAGYPQTDTCEDWSVLEAGSANGELGWVIFKDPDGKGKIASNEKDIIERVVFDDRSGKVGVDVATGPKQPIRFSRKGLLASKGTTIVVTISDRDTKGPSFDREIKIASNTGRITNQAKK